MNSSLKPFFIQLAIFSVFTLGVLLAWQQFAPARFQTNTVWFVWGFFVLTTALIHMALMKVVATPKKFVYYFMGLTGIKMFGYLIIILIYLLLKLESPLGFTLFFLTMYVLYSGLEVFTLLKHFRK